MKKIIGILTGAKEEKQTTQLNENMEECGMPGAMGNMPSTPPVTMSVNLNAQGVDNIRELLNLMRTSETEPGYHQPVGMPMPAVGLDMPIAVTKISGHDDEPDMGDEPEMGDKPKTMPAGDDGDRGMAQIRDLISKADKPEEEAYANEPDEKYASTDDVIASGDDLHRQKTMHPATAGGDNPMAVREASIRQALDQRYKEIKEGRTDEWSIGTNTPGTVGGFWGSDIKRYPEIEAIIKQMKPTDYVEYNAFNKTYPDKESYAKVNHNGDYYYAILNRYRGNDEFNFINRYNRDNNNLTVGQWLSKAKNKLASAITGNPEEKVPYKAYRYDQETGKGSNIFSTKEKDFPTR